MFAGFDYGTSNCAMGVVTQEMDKTAIQLLPIDNGRTTMPSALYALGRELICEHVGLNINSSDEQRGYIQLRGNALNQARRVRQELDIAQDEQSVYIGEAAFEKYLSMPEEGYFVKSPKSFLGASGLRAEYKNFFEDIVTAMMQTVKLRAESQLGCHIDQTVIGRPVNFQGLNAEQSNSQAIDILSTAAQRAGFKQFDFLYEPIAAGLDFESNLNKEKIVLVVDIGGGTTDCAMVRMGPEHAKKLDRSDDFLGHSGERIGGNDLDIQLAGNYIMPLFGMNSHLKSGLPMPRQVFWDAVSTNDVSAQNNFNSQKTLQSLVQFMKDSEEPKIIERMLKLQEDKLNHQLVRQAEQGKINLSSAATTTVLIDYIERDLTCTINREQMAKAINKPIAKMTDLMKQAIQQATRAPDLVYVTGGSAKSPIIRQAIQTVLGDIQILDGDHFGSVATGLTAWANKIYR